MQKIDCIIRRSRGDLWHFFHSDKEGLCLRKKHNGKWSEHEILLENVHPDFSVLCDGDDNFHMACQDTEGNILYLAYHHDLWHKYTLLKSKTPNTNAKHIKLILTGSQLQLFYTIRTTGRTLLFHQIIKNEDEPTVVDVVRDSLRPFFVVCDDYYNTWIYYQNVDGFLGCRKYKWSQKSLEDFASTEQMAADSPFVHIDSFGRHHIAAIQKGSLIYLQRSTNGEFSEKKQVHFASEDSPAYLPIILGDISKMWLMWKQGNLVYYSSTADDGSEWSAPVRFLSTGVPPKLFALQRNSICSYCWGYISDSDVHLFVIGKDNKPLQPTQPAPKIRYAGQDVEEFARRHIGEFGKPQIPDAQPSPDDIELTKLKILLSALSEQIANQKKDIELLGARVAKLEQGAAENEPEPKEPEKE